jgi:hypothetical protein
MRALFGSLYRPSYGLIASRNKEHRCHRLRCSLFLYFMLLFSDKGRGFAT